MRNVGISCVAARERDASDARRGRGTRHDGLNVQEAQARALLIDPAELDDARTNGDVLTANSIMMDAFHTDVRTELSQWRVSIGLPADPMLAFAESGYAETIAQARKGGRQAGWGS